MMMIKLFWGLLCKKWVKGGHGHWTDRLAIWVFYVTREGSHPASYPPCTQINLIPVSLGSPGHPCPCHDHHLCHHDFHHLDYLGLSHRIDSRWKTSAQKQTTREDPVSRTCTARHDNNDEYSGDIGICMAIMILSIIKSFTALFIISV